MGLGVVATGARGVLSRRGVRHKVFFVLLGKLRPGKGRPKANRSTGQNTTDIPRSRKFPRHSGPPLARETPPPQGEDCRRPATRGVTRSRRISESFNFAFRFDPSASNPHPSSQRDTRRKRTVPDHNQAPHGFARGITPHGASPQEARPFYRPMSRRHRKVFSPISSQHNFPTPRHGADASMARSKVGQQSHQSKRNEQTTM